MFPRYFRRGGDHFSRMAVAGHLKRSTRSSSDAGSISDPIWPFSGWGLPCLRCHHQSGALLPHHFTLTSSPSPCGASAARRCRFCGTFPQVTPGGCYPPPCPAEPGLSSPIGTAQRSGHLACSKRANSFSSLFTSASACLLALRFTNAISTLSNLPCNCNIL